MLALWIIEGLPVTRPESETVQIANANDAFTIPIWKSCKFGSKLLCVKTEALTHAARWHVLLCALFGLVAILPFGYAQSIAELKSKAEDGDVQAQLARARAYHLGERKRYSARGRDFMKMPVCLRREMLKIWGQTEPAAHFLSICLPGVKWLHESRRFRTLKKGLGSPAGSPCCFGWIAVGKPRRYR